MCQAAAAGITIIQKRASQICDGDVVALPETVCVATRTQAGAWTWDERNAAQLPNPHSWRWVYDAGSLSDHYDGIADCVSSGYIIVRVSDDRPNQGSEYNDLIVCLREHDLVATQQSDLNVELLVTAARTGIELYDEYADPNDILSTTQTRALEQLRSDL